MWKPVFFPILPNFQNFENQRGSNSRSIRSSFHQKGHTEWAMMSLVRIRDDIVFMVADKRHRKNGSTVGVNPMAIGPLK